MNLSQQRFLLNRLDEAKRVKPGRYEKPKRTEPAAVKAAREKKKSADKVLENWQKKLDRERTQRNKKIDEAFAAAKTEILFKDSPAAIAAVEKFERLQF